VKTKLKIFLTTFHLVFLKRSFYFYWNWIFEKRASLGGLT
jgi:hypothetical protein